MDKMNENRMLYINGVCQYCECGCNVFQHTGISKDGLTQVSCNSCGARYLTDLDIFLLGKLSHGDTTADADRCMKDMYEIKSELIEYLMRLK